VSRKLYSSAVMLILSFAFFLAAGVVHHPVLTLAGWTITICLFFGGIMVYLDATD
jgi:hypothetical protein